MAETRDIRLGILLCNLAGSVAVSIGAGAVLTTWCDARTAVVIAVTVLMVGVTMDHYLFCGWKTS